MKKFWHVQPGPLFSQQPTLKEKIQTSLVIPWLYFYLCLCQLKDAVFFGFFACYYLMIGLRKNVDLQAKNPKKSSLKRQNELSQSVTALIPLETAKKCRTRTWNLSGWTFVILLLIIGQIPILWQNFFARKAERNVVAYRIEQKTEYYPVPEEINLEKLETIERGLIYLSSTINEDGLTQNEKINLALRAFYQNDWSTYQSWLQAAQAMDPNARIFK